jgi:hypothetical protein
VKYIVNVQSVKPDLDPRSLRERVKNRDKVVLRDTYYLINPEDKNCDSRRLGNSPLIVVWVTCKLDPSER